MARTRIADGQPMSARTIARRRKEAGLAKVVEPARANEAFFATWSEELAWVIGLIWSDGCLYGNTVEISSKDLQLIDLLLSLIGGRYALKNRGQHIRVHFTSRSIATFLRSIGLTERKSLTACWPSMPPEYLGAFMRGLIDGDGSVFVKKMRPGQQVPDITVQLVTASEALKNGVQAWFDHHGIRYSLHARNRENILWRFAVGHQQSLRILFDILYPHEDVVCLHRKRAPFVEWMATPRARSGRPRT